MARLVNRLSPARVQKAKVPGMYPDGAGLYLHIGPSGGRSWIYRYMIDGRPRQMGLGPFPDVPLTDAREAARQERAKVRGGTDPIDARKGATAARRGEAAKAITFKACAQKYIAANRAGWRNTKHAAQWNATLATYAYPIIGDLSVAAVDTGHVTRILEPIWAEKSETASRVRGRVESVLDFATTHRWRTGPNPAAWRGHLEHGLPKRSKVAKVQHHAALPWQQVGAFMAELERQDGTAAIALRFAILTAGRTGEVIGATWAEIDFQAAIWTVPETRTKAGRQHRVPLASATLELLRSVASTRENTDPNAFVFPGGKTGKGLSNMAMLALLRRMGRDDLTTHGFRSSFRDWTAETGQPADIAEAALAHVVGDKTVAAYRRGDLLDRRRRLMDAWCSFCGRTASATGEVVELRGAAA